MWKKYKNNKTKTIAPTWNEDLELPDGSYCGSDMQDYIEYIIKKHEISTTSAAIYIYINRIDNRSVFKIKDGYKLELQNPETIELFCSTKKLIDKTKSGQMCHYLK